MMNRLLVVSILIGALLVGTVADAAAAGGTHSRRHRAHRHRGHRHICRKGKHHRRKQRRCRASRRLRANAASASLLVQTGATAYSAQVSWPAASGTRTTRIYLNGQLIDQINAQNLTSYSVPSLWPQTSFLVTAELVNAGGQTLARYSRSVLTTAATGSFPRFYAASAFINTPISDSPALAANSGAMISQAITSYASHANLSDNQAWGIPIANAGSQSYLYSVACLKYGCGTYLPKMHIPSGAAPDTGSDGHLVVLQPNGNELDMWIGQHTPNGWAAGSRSVQSAGGSALGCTPRHGCSAANAAGFALAAGVIRPEEIAQGHIDHALAITTPDTRRGYIACPATGSDGSHSDASALPIGGHLQLDPRLNVASLPIPGWQRVIATALQQYGAYVVDTGGSLAVEAESVAGRGYNAWAKAGVPANGPSLAGLPWSSMRVLSMTSCGS